METLPYTLWTAFTVIVILGLIGVGLVLIWLGLSLIARDDARPLVLD
jgi:hypothetical protein